MKWGFIARIQRSVLNTGWSQQSLDEVALRGGAFADTPRDIVVARLLIYGVFAPPTLPPH